MLKFSLTTLVSLPIAALGLALAVPMAKAADLKPVVPGGATFNKFDFTGTLSLKARSDGTIFVDFQPLDDFGTQPALLGTTACSDEVSSSILDLACTTAAESNQPGTEGQYNYAQQDAGVGAFDEFETPSASFSPKNGVSRDVLLPIFVPGSRDFFIDDFLKMDAQTLCSGAGAACNGGSSAINPVANPLAVDSGLNYFDVTRLNEIKFDEIFDGAGNFLRTNVSFTVGGIYQGPDAGPLNGSLSYALTFDGIREGDALTPGTVKYQIFNPAGGVTQKGFQGTGTAVAAAVPEPSSVVSLALAAVSSGLFLSKGKKKQTK